MTSPPFPELRITALVENVEAVAQNIEEAITFEIGRVVGFTAAASPPFSADIDCSFEIGDGILWDTVERVLRVVCQVFRTILNRVFDVVAALTGTIADFLSGIVDRVVDTVGNLVNTLTAQLSGLVSAIVTKLEQVIGAIVSTLTTLVGALVDKMREVITKIEDILGAIFNRIATVVETIINKIKDVFTALLNAATFVISRIGDGIAAIIATLINTVELVFTRVGNALSALINTLTGVAEAGLGKVRDVIESIPATLRELFDEAREFAGETIGKPLANIGELFITQLEGFFEQLIERIDVNPRKILTGFLTGIGLPSDEVERIAGPADAAMPRTPALFVVAMGALVPFLVAPMVTAILSPAIEQVRQEVAQRVTPTLIPTADAIDAFLRGEMDEDQLRQDLGEAGFNRRRQDILLRSSRRLLDLGQVFRWWLRGFISEDELDVMLTHRRIGDEDKALLKQSVFFIPPVGDLIRMAVREVFSPEIRERFGQDEGFPEEFAEFGAQQGVSEFWAKAYWAAHWTLPSPQQGFEMLHRKVIETDDLDLLLRAQDVMPFWRERLVQIAFSPLTRVDLRRMHKLGLFDEEELQRRYEDLGFAPDNAALMVQFTLAFNAEDPPEERGELEGLTRATVLGMYEDGVITRGQANEVMLALGFSEDAAELFLVQRDLEIERANRKAEIQLVLDQVRSGAIAFDEGQDRLAGLGLQPAEMSKATVALLREQERLTAVPPRGDLDKMLAAELIGEDEYRDAMRSRGFTRAWADRYLILSRAG